MYSAFIRRCSAFYRRANKIKQRTPLLNQLHLNFIFLHYTYIITWALIGSIIVYPGGGITYTDALFLSVGAATQSSLKTVNLNALQLYQQIVLYIITIICTPIFIHSALVFIRLYWFEKRFQRVVRDARALRTTRSRMDNVCQDNDSEGTNRAELEDGGRSIVVLRSNTGDVRGSKLPWWGIFTSASAFDDLGFTLTPDSMISFQKAVFLLLLMAFLIIIGNTGFPCMLRLVIWSLTKFARPGTALWEELKFLLDHPRRCFTLLFPRNATWWLFAILIALNGIDVIFFIILDVSLPANDSIHIRCLPLFCS